MIAFLPVSKAAIVIDPGQVRVQGNRFGIVLDGTVKIAPLVCLDSIAEIFLGIRNVVGGIVSLGVGKASKIREEEFFMDVMYFFQFLPYLGFAFRFDDYLFRRQLLRRGREAKEKQGMLRRYALVQVGRSPVPEVWFILECLGSSQFSRFRHMIFICIGFPGFEFENIFYRLVCYIRRCYCQKGFLVSRVDDKHFAIRVIRSCSFTGEP